MRRIKFSLRGLILLVTAVGLFLGYSQYRRREILSVCVELSEHGYVFPVKDEWFDRYVWQRKPLAGTITKGAFGKHAVVCRKAGWRKTHLFVTYNEEEVDRFQKSGLVNYSNVPPPNPDPTGILK
jgi:hypothetical protein